MKKIEEIDPNFRVESDFRKNGLFYYSSDKEPFRIHGLIREGGVYRRIPEAVASAVNEGVAYLHTNTAGGRVRFRTASRRVSIRAVYDSVGKMPHFALTGSAGFDLYADGAYAGTFMPPFDVGDELESMITLGRKKERELLIEFPLYSGVKELYIGLDRDTPPLAPAPYRHPVPMVYYGSSITQGGCASRPGTSYQALVSRALDADYINLGFSGSARGEDAIVAYMKDLAMSVFVLDYDHNAPSPEHLSATHEKAFRAVREAHPDLPIVVMSRPKYRLTKDEKERLRIIRETVSKAKAAGDEKVFLLDGKALTRLCRDEGTVDGCHPTDLGFFAMARALEELIRKEKLLG
ncbi:MAG: SGNH/GDSL hydrolase family protein [Clostridia bacterium]|nr:SGNH/GDSL hydrolase family protein [Clostridia bacterium]